MAFKNFKRIKVLLFLITLFIFTVLNSAYAEFTIQVGVFKIKQNAKNLAVELQDKGFSARVAKLGDGFARVWIGRFNTRWEAVQFSRTLKKKGYPVWIKEIEEIKGQKSKVKNEKVKTEKVSVEKEEKIKWEEATGLEVASYKDKTRGKKLRDELNKKGYFTYLLMEVKNKNVYYKVVVSKQEKESLPETAERLKKDGYKFKIIK